MAHVLQFPSAKARLLSSTCVLSTKPQPAGYSLEQAKQEVEREARRRYVKYDERQNLAVTCGSMGDEAFTAMVERDIAGFADTVRQQLVEQGVSFLDVEFLVNCARMASTAECMRLLTAGARKLSEAHRVRD